MFVPLPVSMAWIARGVATNRTSSSASGFVSVPRSENVDHVPSTTAPGAWTRTSRPSGQLGDRGVPGTQRDPAARPGLAQCRGEALEDALIVLGDSVAPQELGRTARRVDRRRAEQPGVPPQRPGGGVVPRQFVRCADHGDQLVPQELLHPDAVGTGPWCRPDGDVDRSCREQPIELIGCPHAHLDVQVVGAGGEQLDHSRRSDLAEQRRHGDPQDPLSVGGRPDLVHRLVLETEHLDGP